MADFLRNLYGAMQNYQVQNQRAMDQDLFSKMMAVNPQFAMQYQSGMQGMRNQNIAEDELMRERAMENQRKTALAQLAKTPGINPQAALGKLSAMTGDPRYLGSLYEAQAKREYGLSGSSATERQIERYMQDNPGVSYTEAMQAVASANLRGRLAVSDQEAAAEGEKAYEKRIRDLEARFAGGEAELEGDIARAVEEEKTVAERTRRQEQGLSEGRKSLIQAQRNLQSKELSNEFVNDKIQEVRDLASGWTTGLQGGLLSALPNTDAYDLKLQVDTLLANSGFDTLTALKEAGGTLGAVSEKELALLQATKQNLLQSQNQKQFLSNLEKFKKQRELSLQAIREAYEQDYKRYGGEQDPNLPSPEETFGRYQGAAETTQDRRQRLLEEARRRGLVQ